MGDTGMEQSLSMPGENLLTGGGPAIKVRFNVRLCVAESGRVHPGLSPQ